MLQRIQWEEDEKSSRIKEMTLFDVKIAWYTYQDDNDPVVYAYFTLEEALRLRLGETVILSLEETSWYDEGIITNICKDIDRNSARKSNKSSELLWQLSNRLCL